MITTEIYNGQGHGNQLWCYVVTRVIALDNGYEFGIAHPERMKSANFMNLDFGKPVVGGEILKEGGVPLSLPEGIQYYYSEKKIDIHEHIDVRLFDKNLVNIPDNTKIDGLMQDEQYIAHRKDEIREWLRVKPEFQKNDYASDNICVIYLRGGEISRFKNVFLGKKYWDDAISNMRKINPDFRFVVVTDDENTAKKFFPDFEILHFKVEIDYAILNVAHYAIIANSSFGFFPIWLNENIKKVIAPKYWAAHNDSDGYWSLGQNIVNDWQYQDRDGNLQTASECEKEFAEYIETNPKVFKQQKIEENFLVVSAFQNDITWVPEYTENYKVYDRNENEIYPPNLDEAKVIKTNTAENHIRDFLRFIVDQYDNLPKQTIFAQGNIFQKYVSKEYFDSIVNNKTFTLIQQERKHHRSFSSENYIVPKEYIQKYSKTFYQNLCIFAQTESNALVIERALCTIWNEKHEITVDTEERIVANLKNSKRKFSLHKSANVFYAVKEKIYYFIKKIPAFMQFIKGQRDIRTLWYRPEIAGIARIRNTFLTGIHLLKKAKKLAATIATDHYKNWRDSKKFSSKEDKARLKKILQFPILESDALQRKVDYSFGAHSGVIGHVPYAYIKKANLSNTEFAEKVSTHKGEVMTLFIDNLRLYNRPHPFRDWLDMKPTTAKDKAWLKTLEDEDLLKLVAHFPEKKFIIFTALEDRPLDKYIEGKIPGNVISINAANAVHFGGKIIPWPHALERKMYFGYNHHEILKRFLLDTREAKKMLYVNHRNDTGDRGSLYELFSNKSWATVSHRVDYTTYLNGIKDHKFVLCPSGNGIESARNWETLYMRRVPVFKRHPCLEFLFKDFPALFVDDWNEVTEELLKKNEHLYEEALKMDINKLNLDILFAERIKEGKI